MTFAQRVLDYHWSLKPDWKLPVGVELLYPYEAEETRRVMTLFFLQYYSDHKPRMGLFGINPGRFGAGVTGVPFTSPDRLESELGIANNFAKKAELSSEFVYRVVNAWGGPTAFYGQFYVSSLCPLGFTKAGKNYNYYDDPALRNAVEPYIAAHLEAQLELGLSRETAFCLGQGQNAAYFERINQQYGFFRKIVALPHPRWVMQYRRRSVEAFVQTYLEALGKG